MKKNPFQFLDQITIEHVNNKIADALEELRFYSPLKILKIIKLFDVISKEGQYSETQENIENIQLREIKRYLTSVYMSYKIDFVDEALCKEYSYENIKTLFNKISDACKYSELYLAFHKNNGDVNESVKLYESVDGRTYICFSYSILSALLQAQADLLQNCYHIDYKEFDEGLKKLWEQLICLQIPKRLEKGELIYHVDEIVDKSNCCIEDITGWPSQLIRDLSYELGEDTSFFCRAEYPGWYDVEMPITKKPFIRIEGFSYCFDHNICFDCFYRAIQKVIQSKSSQMLIEWKENQTQITERLTGDFLDNVFDKSENYNNVYYQSDKKWVEADGLIVYNNLIINYEVKGGAYTPDSIYLNAVSHEKAEETLIVKAIKQAKRFVDQLKKDKKIDLYDEKKNYIKTITTDDETLLISIAVTLEPLGEINCIYNNGIGKNPENEGVIILSLYDLAIYSNFFTSPVFFAHYLSERIKPINKINLSNSDELNYLGNYLDNIKFFEYLNNNFKHDFKLKNSGQIILAPAYEDIDKYFAIGMKSARPDFRVDAFLKQIIYALDNSECSNKIEMGLFLLNLSEDVQNRLKDNVIDILDRQNKRCAFSSMLLKLLDDEKHQVLLFANKGQCYATVTKARDYSIAYAIAFHCESVQYLIINFQSDDSIVVKSDKVNEKSAMMYKPGYFDELVQMMKLRFCSGE